MNPAPDWYPDPESPERLRWWDGSQWTEHVHARVGADQPASTADQPAADTGHGLGVTAAANRASAPEAPGRAAPTGAAPTGSAPTGSAPTGSAPTGSDPTSSQPTAPGSAAPQTAAPESASPEHTTPQPATPENATKAPRKRSRLVPIIVITSVVVVLALVTTFAVVGVRSLLGLDRTFALATQAQSVKGRDYVLTEPLLNVPTSSSFTFSVTNAFGSHVPEGAKGSDWAFQMFLDPSLTVPASLSISQPRGGAELKISPLEMPQLVSANGGPSQRVMSKSAQIGDFGLEPEYYLVRHVDENGAQLTHPVVTRITTAPPPLASPGVSAEKIAKTGSMKLSWSPVDGATEYVIVGSYGVQTNEGTHRQYSVLGTTNGTTWDSTGDLSKSGSDSYPTAQNTSMKLFIGQSADDLLSTGSTSDSSDPYDMTGFRWGVVATDGTRYSRIGGSDAASIVGSLPLQVATFALGDLMHIQGPDGASQLPTSFPFTGLDGRTWATQARIPEGGIARTPGNGIVVRLEGVGTQLGVDLSWWDHPDGLDPEKVRADFNARAAAAAPTTGLGGFAAISGTLDQVAADANPVSTPAKVPYPVYGSDDYVKFIAAHLIAGTEYVDLSAFANAPGAQTAADALSEAYYQNPYIVGLADTKPFTLSSTGEKTILRVQYGMKQADRQQLQKSIAHAVDAILASTVHDGMSDAEKATALNDWLAAKDEYNSPARDALANTGKLPAEYSSVSRADGSLITGSAICSGYAIGYSALMNAAGVPTVVVTGDVLVGGPHAWNKVKIDGKWEAVDVTWNDSPRPNRYLLIDDSGFTDSATRVEDTAWIRDDLVRAHAAG